MVEQPFAPVGSGNVPLLRRRLDGGVVSATCHPLDGELTTLILCGVCRGSPNGQIMSSPAIEPEKCTVTTSQNKEEQSVLVSGDHGHGRHHCEVLIMNRDADGPGASGHYYNSLGVVDDVSDEDFDARFLALDPEKLRKEHGGDGVRFNGPRRFLADRFEGEAFDRGKISILGPIPMYLYGTFVVPDFDAFIAGKQTSYRASVSKRTTTWFFEAGSEVYELVSPEGIVFVIQSASLRVHPDNTVDRLPTLGERLALPEGWTFRTRTLENELVMRSVYDSDPPNTVVLDEPENNYQRLRTV